MGAYSDNQYSRFSPFDSDQQVFWSVLDSWRHDSTHNSQITSRMTMGVVSLCIVWKAFYTMHYRMTQNANANQSKVIYN